jgi:hypothetical protein
MGQSTDSFVPPEEIQKEIMGRRQLLKLLAATSGAAAASGSLPDRWLKPVVEVGVLPAHAQGSLGVLEVVLTWQDPSVAVDLNLRVQEPDGTEVNSSNLVGPTLTHSGDDFPPGGSTGQETVRNKPGGISISGVYEVYIDWITADLAPAVEPDPQITLTISTHTDHKTISPDLSSGSAVLAATVSFLTGAIDTLI